MSTPAEVRAACTAATVAATEAAEAAALANAAALEAVQASQAAALLAAELPDQPDPTPEPEPEPEPPAGTPRFGYYPAANTSIWDERVAAFESTTGIDVAQVGGNQDQRYEGARGSVVGVFGNTVQVPTITCAIQLAFTGDPYGDTQGPGPGAIKRKALQATIDGRNDSLYEANLARMRGSRWRQIILRLGSEGDIPYPPHSFHPGTEPGAKANDDLYRAAYSHVHKIFKDGLTDRVRFSYTTTAFAAERRIVCQDGQTRTALAAGYPGDQLVDIVGIDCYLGEPLTTVQRLVKAGLEFAKAHRKPAAFDEWGINPKGLERPEAEQCGFMRWVPTLPLEYASFFGGWAGKEGKPGTWWPDDYPGPVRLCLVDAWA